MGPPNRIPPPRDQVRPAEHAPHLLRFGLRQLFVLVTLLTLLVALMAATDGAWPLVIGSTAALVAAHVFGAVVGARLRDTSADVERWRVGTGQGSDRPRADRQPPAVVQPQQASSLAERHAAPLRDRWALVAGAASGFVLGAAVIFAVWGHRIGIPATLVGAVSTAVIGAWIAWIAISFAAIARHAWRHANVDHARDVERKRQAYLRRIASSPSSQQPGK